MVTYLIFKSTKITKDMREKGMTIDLGIFFFFFFFIDLYILTSKIHVDV